MTTDMLFEGYKLPRKIQTGLENLCKTMKELYGKNLESVVLYGGLARGEYLPKTSDVNLMIILKEITVDDLNKALKPVRKGIRDFRLAPFFLSHENLIQSTDVFPIKFLDIREHHHVILGKDLFKDLKISREYLRLQCEQEMKNMMLRLRQFYLRSAHRTKFLQNILTDTISSFLVPLKVMLKLKTKETINGNKELIVSASEIFDLDKEALLQVLRLKEKNIKMKRENLESLYERFMECVTKTTYIAHTL